MSPYTVAIDHTTSTIDRRAKYFRNLIVVVVLVGFISSVWAIVAWESFALAGLALLLPTCGFYFFLDSKVLNRWRTKLFENWAKGELDFEVLRQTMAGLNRLPGGTLQSMLATLPSADDILVEQGISANTRKAIVSVLISVDACRSSLIAVKVVVYTISVTALTTAFVFWKWQPLLGLTVFVFLPFLRKLLCSKYLLRARSSMVSTKEQPDFNPEKYEELVAPLNWSPVSVKQKKEFLAKVCEN